MSKTRTKKTDTKTNHPGAVPNEGPIQTHDAFQPDEVQLAAWAKAVAHPARLAILKVLAARNTCIGSEIVDELPLAQATVSQHLKALKAAGLVADEVEGPRTCYCLNWTELQRFREAVVTLFDEMGKNDEDAVEAMTLYATEFNTRIERLTERLKKKLDATEHLYKAESNG